jgi:hypothetical protein
MRIQDSSAAVTYVDSWFVNAAAVHSGGTARLSVDPGDRATLAFNGTGVTWIAYRDEWSGQARVLIDGALVATVDLYRTPQLAQTPVYSASGLTRGAHTIAIEVTGTRNAASGGNGIWVDAFDVTP